MRLEEAALQLRPRSLWELTDLAVPFLLRVDPWGVTRLMTVLLAPPLLLAMVLRLGDASWASLWLIVLPFGPLTAPLVTSAVGQLLFERRIIVRRVLWDHLRQLPSRSLMGVAQLFAASWMFPPPTTFLPEVRVLEQLRGGAAFRRAWHLGMGRALLCYGLFGLLALEWAAGILTLESLGQGVVGFVLQLGTPVGSLLDDGGSLFSLAGFLVATFVHRVVVFLAYVDLRTRHEGWDLQVRIGQLDAASTGVP